MASRSTSGGTVLASGIRTREKKERKLYSDDWALGDEEIEGHHTFNLEEKINTSKFDLNFVKDMTDSEFNLSYMQKNGFNWPLLFRSKKNLGIVVPSGDFSINDVRLCVGSRRMLDVMDVNTQKNVEMTMKDWQRYYESQDKDKLLNVISLEFSHTKLETLVEAPTVVRQIDWVEKVWPRHLKEAQTESTNVLEDMMYPKVQKYCLMSVSGCYTDFHIDFGGTSVWYHILKGKKIFWLIPPSERNLQLYEQWVLSGKQSDTFFGDTVEKCARVELQAGNTFFIPTGWIHAVYTPEDSLVFGGNFLHSFGIEKQLRVAHVEDTTHVPQKFRYPFFTEMLWYLLERYVHVLLGRTHLTLPPEEQEKYEKAVRKTNNNNKPKEHIHLTQYELHGMKAIVMYLHSLPTSKKFVPELIKDPIALIRDVRTVVEHHRYDSPELAVTNQPVMEWWEREPVKFTVKRSVCDPTIYVKKRRQSGDEPKSSVVKLPPNAAKVRHRRIRCKECEPCTREDCQKCVFCKDMVKYGGGGTMKQTCKLKKCAQPVLPASASCYICHLDGWMRPVGGISVKPSSMRPSSLMECIICFKISHSSCIETEFKGIECSVNEDLPSSWECAECIQLGYHKEYKHNRAPSSRVSSSGSDTIIKSPSALSDVEETKTEVKNEKSINNEEENSKPTLNGASSNGQEKSNIGLVDPPALKMPTWDHLQNRVSYPLVQPSWVIRPAPPPLMSGPNEDEDDYEFDSATEDEREGRKCKTLPPLPMRKEVMFPIFTRLSRNTLLTAMRVCRQWAEWAIDPSLWVSLSLAHSNVNEYKLHGVVRRQPTTLILDWCEISYDEFLWLLCRLPQLQTLHCEGLSWRVINPLVSPYCPPLSELNLSFCEGVDDDTLSSMLRTPPFNRPGFRDTTSRLRQLSHLRLAGTQVGDTGVNLIARSLPFLTHLDLSGCLRITNCALEFLAHSTSLVSHSLTSLDLRGCHHLTPMILPLLAQLPILSQLALYPCDFIPLKAIKVWGLSNGYLFNDLFIMRRTPEIKTPVDDISDSEIDTVAVKKENQETENDQRCYANDNLKKEEGNKTKSSACEDKVFKSKCVKKKEIPYMIQNDKKEYIEIQCKNFKSIPKIESPQLKCVLTPLEKNCKALEGKFQSSSVELVPTKNEELDESKDIKIKRKFSDSERKASSLCRRSERSNKGRKYKLSIAKRKGMKEKLEENKKFLNTESEILPQKNLEKSSPSSKQTEKHYSSSVKRKSKSIITRSKKQKMNEEAIKSKPEYEVVKKCLTKSLRNIKEPCGKRNNSSEIEDSLKVRIALKSSNCESVKLTINKQDDSSSSGKTKEQKEVSIKGDEIRKSDFTKNRKERRGSSSSSSSCSSPAPCISLSKKLKVELKPISKIGRRKSEVLKGTLSVSTTTDSSTGSSSLPSQGSSSGEKSSNRERPERHHRSPRRLSMCQ